jgi:acyl phosphate:glycerol-3-phosphate acyltransferase
MDTLNTLFESPIGIVILISAYLLGSIPFGFLIAKIFLGYDIRTVGSGNIGMTNMVRTGGKIPGIATFVFDVGKGSLAIFIAIYFVKSEQLPEIVIILAAFLAVFGHTCSIFLKFKGGKGVATTVGVLLIFDIKMFLAFGLTWLLVFIVKRISSLSALIALLVLPIATFYFYHFGGKFYLSLILSSYIILLHHENIKRLLQGSENKLKTSK